MSKEKNKLFISSVLMIFSIIISLFHINNMIFINIPFYILGILGSIYFIYLSYSDINIKDKCSIVLIISIIFFLNNVISGVIGFSIYKNIRPKLNKIKKLEEIKEHNKYIYLLLLILYLFIVMFGFKYVENITIKLIIYIIIMLVTLFLFKDRLKRDFKYYKKYHREYNSLVLKAWGISLIINMFLSILIRFITNINTATNQEVLQGNFYEYPIIIGFLSIIYAPITEELMFRGVVKKIIKNKYLFIITSALIFGLIHVIDDFKSYEELLYIFIYASLGGFLAYLYEKTNNIFTNITFHMLQNAYSVIGMIILYFMK